MMSTERPARELLADGVSWGSCKEHAAWTGVRHCALVRPHLPGRKPSPDFDLAETVSLCRSLSKMPHMGCLLLCAGKLGLCLSNSLEEKGFPGQPLSPA